MQDGMIPTRQRGTDDDALGVFGVIGGRWTCRNLMLKHPINRLYGPPHSIRNGGWWW